MITQVYSARV